jgi:hypothetical protein
MSEDVEECCFPRATGVVLVWCMQREREIVSPTRVLHG